LINYNNRIVYALLIGAFLAGLSIIFMWGHTSKLIGIGLVVFSIFGTYLIYGSRLKAKVATSGIDIKNILLGLLLIIVNLTYNFLSEDALRSFDYGMLLSGLFIVFLNSNILSFLKLDEKLIDFISYFLFIFMLSLGFLGPGITFINNYIYGSHGLPNPIYILMTNLAIKNSVFVLDLIKPTTSINNIINFDGFRVGISYPCSGIESLTVFLSAIIAYFSTKVETNLKKIAISTFIGITFFYSLNILRIVLIILVGYSFGSEALNFTHNNLGWVLFVIGMSLFWYLILDGETENEK
jgi:exosortase/archaeosortase family protein